MEPHNQGSLGGTRWEEVGGTRWVLGNRGDGPQVGLVDEANQRWRRVQRDKRVVWERPGGVRVRVQVCGPGGLNKVGVSWTLSWRRLGLRQVTRCQLTLCTRAIVWLATDKAATPSALMDGVAVRPGSTGETDLEIR